MDALRLETMSMRPRDAAESQRKRAIDVAAQFETVFVRTLVQSLRQTATVGGGGMFGGGIGADTYADWFDQNVAEQLTATGRLGIAGIVLEDMRRHGEMPAAADGRGAAHRLQRAATALPPTTTTAKIIGGLDVVL